MPGLTKSEVLRLVNQYIGSSRGPGYLGDFSIQSHAEFYPGACGLDLDPDKYEGTTRQRFISILLDAPPRDQAKILRGVLERFHVGGPGALGRTSELRDWVLALVARLEGASPVESRTPEDASAVVERAIGDAETLLQTSGASSGVDRIHTALHGYLRDVCRAAQVAHAPEATIATLLKVLRSDHPAFTIDAVRRDDVSRVLRGMGTVVDALDPLRNNASAAHPNELLEEPEAMLVINAARTILHYVEARIRALDDRPLRSGS